MKIRKHHYFFYRTLFLVCICFYSQVQGNDSIHVMSHEDSLKIRSVWCAFLKALSTQDYNGLKRISTDTIKCPECIYNTKQERVELAAFEDSVKNGYQFLYKQKDFIPIDVFIRDDIPIMIDQEVLDMLNNQSPKFGCNIFEGCDRYHVIVLTTKPGVVAKGHEGGEHVFEFKKVNNIFKFFSFFTVP